MLSITYISYLFFSVRAFFKLTIMKTGKPFITINSYKREVSL
jgi:hypothetical protein